MRTTNPNALHQADAVYDHHLFQFLRHLITGDGAGFVPMQQRIHCQSKMAALESIPWKIRVITVI